MRFSSPRPRSGEGDGAVVPGEGQREFVGSGQQVRESCTGAVMTLPLLLRDRDRVVTDYTTPATAAARERQSPGLGSPGCEPHLALLVTSPTEPGTDALPHLGRGFLFVHGKGVGRNQQLTQLLTTGPTLT